LIWNPNAPDQRSTPGQPWWTGGEYDSNTPLLNLEAVRGQSRTGICEVSSGYAGGDIYTIPIASTFGSSPWDPNTNHHSGCDLTGSPIPYLGKEQFAPQNIDHAGAAENN